MKSQLSQKTAQKRKKKEFHHGDLKNAAIAAATRLIAQKGSVEFTVREVAKVVGVSHVALFNHFEDKSAILAEVAKNGFRGLIESMQSRSIGQSSALSCAKAYLNFGLNHPSEFRAMFHPSIKPFTKYPGLSEIALESFQALTDEVKKAKPDASAELSLAIWGAVHGITTLEIDGQFTSAVVAAKGNRLAAIQRTLALVVGALVK